MPDEGVINVVLAGLGGQGVIKASDILAEAAFRAGYDVKKSEIHGMSQRGGSVSSDVRFGKEVRSPMVPPGEAHFLVILEKTQVEPNRRALSPKGKLITADHIPYFDEENVDGRAPIDKRMLNVAMLGVLSAYLPIPEKDWLEAIRGNVPAKAFDANVRVFTLGRMVEQTMNTAVTGD
jgi:indolepyruvate ferredoxin oxidoreductase beta subunit